MAMTDLASRPAERATSLAAIAASQQISKPYLEQLFSRLRRHGLVRSVRGPGGGYRLGKAAEALSVAEVVAAVDEPLRATRCAGVGPGCMKGGARCKTHDLWAETGRQIEVYLAGVSLADVVAGRLGRQSERAA
jgi:Rrf2 family iron-sulfur cluster assembly transcriptional regulator